MVAGEKKASWAYCTIVNPNYMEKRTADGRIITGLILFYMDKVDVAF